MRKNWVALLGVVLSGLILASCANTIRGAGADIQDSANAVEDVVE